MTGCFIGMRRYLRMIKSLLVTFYSAKFKIMSLKSKPSKVVSYIQDNKSWEKIYVILKILFPCIWVLCNADSKKSGMYRFSNIPEWQRSPLSRHHLILITDNYSQYLAHNISMYLVHQILTLKMNIILILMIQRVLIQILWWAWVT